MQIQRRFFSLLAAGAASVVLSTAIPGQPAPAPGPAADRTTEQRPADAARPADRDNRDNAEAKGNRLVQVRERAIWGLSEVPRNHMREAIRHLVDEPNRAHADIMVMADVVEIQAALSQEPNGNSPAADRLRQQADALRDVARRIERKQLFVPEDLMRPFTTASLALADFYQQQARQGVEKSDSLQTAYTLWTGAKYLETAYTFGGHEPQPEASRAIIDSDRLATQIIHQHRQMRPEREGNVGAADQQNRDDAARAAAARQEADQQPALPPDARRVVDALGSAIQQANQNATPEQGGQRLNPPLPSGTPDRPAGSVQPGSSDRPTPGQR